MKSSSIAMYMGGIKSPKDYRDSIIHDWYLPNNYKRSLSMFMLVETTAEAFFAHSKDGELTINGKQYSITFINSPEALKKNTLVLLSIRYSDYLHRGYVLAKCLINPEKSFNKLEYE